MSIGVLNLFLLMVAPCIAPQAADLDRRFITALLTRIEGDAAPTPTPTTMSTAHTSTSGTGAGAGTGGAGSHASSVHASAPGVGVTAGNDSLDEAHAHVAFRDHTAALVACAYGEEEFADDAQHVRHVEANAARINAWKVCARHVCKLECDKT